MAAGRWQVGMSKSTMQPESRSEAKGAFDLMRLRLRCDCDCEGETEGDIDHQRWGRASRAR